MLKSLGQKGGDIITTSSYDDFEFWWEWKLSPQGNSGIKYFVDEHRGNAGGAIGHEYQTIDDDNYPELALSPLQKTGAFYDVLPPTHAAGRPVGEFNTSRLIVRGTSVEHWLNGQLVLRYDTTSPEVAAGVAASKFKDVRGFADKIRTPILLQDHNRWSGSATSRSARCRRADESRRATRSRLFVILTTCRESRVAVAHDVTRTAAGRGAHGRNAPCTLHGRR